MARYIAKNLVAAKIADKIEIQLSYAIGLPRPQSIYINSFNSSQYNDEQIADIIEHVFDLSVEQIIKIRFIKANISTNCNIWTFWTKRP